MKRRTRERLLKPGEAVSAAELYARLDRYSTTLNGADFEADFKELLEAEEAAADPDLAFRLGMERSCQQTWLGAYCLEHFSPWKAPAKAEAYLQARRTTTTNELLRLRYDLLMVLGLPKGRHTGVLAKEAVDIIQQWLERDRGERERTQETYFDLAQLGILLSKQYRYKPEALLELVVKYLLGSKQPVVLRWWQLGFFSRNAGLLSRETCAALDEVSQQVYDHYKVKERYILKMVCETAIPLAGRASATGARKWHGLLGDFLMAQGQERYKQEPTSFIVQAMFTDALHAYQTAGNKALMQQAEAQISATKHDVRLYQVEQNCTVDGLLGKLVSHRMNGLPSWVLAGEGNRVFWRAVRGGLLPTRPVPQIELPKSEDSLQGIRHIAFDRNRNITTRNQKKAGSIVPFDGYDFALACTVTMTREIFAEGLVSGKISLETTLAFLKDHTWLGEELFMEGNANETTSYAMLPLVEPSLQHYFREMERAKQDADYVPQMMLCIDSLTLKIEGLLRHFGRLTDPPIPTNRTGANGDLQELTLEDIIKSMSAYLEPDGEYFLRFVLTRADGGRNVRNDVAHSFLRARHYSVSMMQLVLLALFIVATMGTQTPEA
jgi:hypothetical protein